MDNTVVKWVPIAGILITVAGGIFGYGVLSQEVTTLQEFRQEQKEENLRLRSQINTNATSVTSVQSSVSTLGAILGRVEADIRSIKEDANSTNELIRELIVRQKQN